MTSSFYSRHKAAWSTVLSQFEASTLISRPRPGLILRPGAGSEIGDYFLGSLVPKALFRHRIPIVPLPNDLVLQFVHSDDVADALVRILRQRPHGPVNLVAEPVITPGVLAELLGGRHVPMPPWLLRLLANVTWRLRRSPLRRDGSTWLSRPRCWTRRGRARNSAGSRRSTRGTHCET